jgi:serine/threonine-protein kinase RsbW
MTGNGLHQIQERLVLRSRLAEIAQVATWIEDLASRHGLPGNVEFAMKLCLEEVLSNVIRHGYSGAEDRFMTVRFAMPRDTYSLFIVDDEAPLFNPLDALPLPVLNPIDEVRVGGQGIRLLRQFADTLEYEQLPNGNRLRIGFSTAGSATPKK